MIYKISKKEFAQEKDRQKNRFHQCLLFTLPNGITYKCDTMGASGLKEINNFRRKMKELEEDRKRLQDLQGVLL